MGTLIEDLSTMRVALADFDAVVDREDLTVRVPAGDDMTLVVWPEVTPQGVYWTANVTAPYASHFVARDTTARMPMRVASFMRQVTENRV